LVQAGTKAKEMLDVMLVANKDYLPQFKSVIAELEAKGVTYVKP
jgi:6-phospho-beta-glucosidase